MSDFAALSWDRVLYPGSKAGHGGDHVKSDPIPIERVMAVARHEGLGDLDSELAVFYDRVLETTCAHQRDELWRRLLERAALTFGRGRRPAWTEVLRITVEKGALKITARLDGRWVKEHHISAGATSALPNLPLLWELLHAAHAYALAQATSANSTDSP